MNEPFDPLELANKRPDWSAKQPVTPAQWVVAGAIVALVVAGFCVNALATGRILVALATVFYVAATLYKLILVRASANAKASFRFTKEQIDALPPRDWPIYSILIPMYKEPETFKQMVAALDEMDYPADRKDVQFLLEEDDDITIAAARSMALPQGFRVTVVPPSFPRTKPKACNYGLHLALGKYLVIYDAEDRPEPLQLKQAVLAFEASPENAACVQSRLNFYNPRFNLLTRWFTADYSAWFDLCLPGLAAMDAMVPLGGTSNHFKMQILRDLMGWDAYNVTEDCDLGVRLCRAGYCTRMLDTTTWEEACSRVPFWIRQRTRWQKGYIQTWFVHMRHPLQLLRELGFVNFLHFHLLIGGSTLSSLLNPIFWIMALLWFFVRPDGVGLLFPGIIFAIGALNLFIGNFFFIYTNLLGCYRRKFDSLAWAVLLTPIYWVMMSISGWRAFLQFFTNPFVWEKTQHGLSSSKNS